MTFLSIFSENSVIGREIYYLGFCRPQTVAFSSSSGIYFFTSKLS